MDILYNTAQDSNPTGKKMEQTFGAFSRARASMTDLSLARGIGWGLIAGFTSTLVMDLCIIGVFAAAGLPVLTSFSIIGDTASSFFALFGVDMAGGILLGTVAHYLIGLALGVIFGTATAKLAGLRVDTLKKSVLLGVLYVELISQPLLASTPILLNMTAHETIQWYGICVLMHMIAGGVLGLVVYLGMRSAARATADKTVA